MSKIFYHPQRQSIYGIVLIFVTSIFHFVRNFWVLGVYFFVREVDPMMILISILGLGAILVLTLIYSIFYYLRFQFYVDPEKKEFILEKGVLSSDIVHVPFSKIQQVNFKRNLLQRMIGVYSVNIDTAGSKDKEVEIKALSKEKANLLGSLLMELSGKEVKEEEKIAESVQGEKKAGIDWEYSITIPTLFKLGLTSNYLRGLALLLAFYFSLKEQFQFTGSLFEDLPNPFMMEMVSTFIVFLLLFLVGMAITVAETFLKYYRLNLKNSKNGLQVEMGLRQNTKVNLKERRVQILQIATNPLQRSLDLFSLKISLASSLNDQKKDQIRIPGLPEAVVRKVCNYFYGFEIKEVMEIRPRKMLLYRKILRGLFPLLFGLGILFLGDFGFSPEVVFGMVIAYLSLMVLYKVFYFKRLKLSVSENFLIKHSGVWIQKKEILEMFKLQSISVSQPLWFKKRDIVHLTFHSAGGDITFRMVSKKEILPLVNYLLFRIESTSKAWM